MSAAISNAITNGLHATCLLVYFLGALRHYRRGTGDFTRLVVGLFLLLFVAKVLGVVVHAAEPGTGVVRAAWALVAALTVLLNDCVLRTWAAPPATRVAAVAISALCALGFVASGGDFMFLALPGLLVFAVTGFRSSGLRRVGFLMAAGSNAAWILARKITESAIGGELAVGLRYDNDAYHFLLIASTFVIYKGFASDGKTSGKPL